MILKKSAKIAHFMLSPFKNPDLPVNVVVVHVVYVVVVLVVTFPRSLLPRDKPDFALSSHQREKTPDLQIFFISGASPKDLHKQI